MKSRKSTSIMNDVKIGKAELNPPTVFNRSSPNGTFSGLKDSKGDLFHSEGLLHKIKSSTNSPDINLIPNDNTEIIGSTLLELSGISKIDNAETILGDTVADAFLMNSWDDTEIRYSSFLFCRRCHMFILFRE